MPKIHKPKHTGKIHQNRNPYKLESVALVIQLRNSNRWKVVRTQVKANFPICQFPQCDQVARTVHHIKMAVDYPELFFHQVNLIPLCDSCHDKASKLERAGKKQEAIDLFDYWEDVIKKLNKNRL